MTVYAGTSGWAYKEWKGSFYPEDLPNDGMLEFYANRLETVEINNTFYRMPKREVLEGWSDQVPEGFRFVLKASRRITHKARLGDDAADPLAYLVGNAQVLGPRLGAILFQTPPWLKGDVDLLRRFVDLIPAGVRGAFEFRSTSWFEDEVFDVLRAGNHALVAADTGNPDKDPPLVATADWGYARLRRVDYTDDDLVDWARRLGEQPWGEVFAFFKHEDDAAGPALAGRFAELMEGAS
jgi:uncharacterized protein YecE (DUF72 family)